MSEQKINPKECGYELYLKGLLEMVKSKGVLVEIKKEHGSFLSDTILREQYKRYWGACLEKDDSGTVTSLYRVYEDFDGSIKYYEYAP